MHQLTRNLLLIFGFTISASSVHAAACNTNDIPDTLLELIKEEKINEAVTQAKATYDKNKDDKEAAFILARVYINATLRSGMNIDLAKLGYGPDEKGSKQVSVDMLKEATSDSYVINEAYLIATDKFIRDVVERWPESSSFYYCLTKIYFYSGKHDNFMSLLAMTAEFEKDNEQEALGFLMPYGLKFVQSRDYARASDVYQILLKTFPKSVPLLSSLGVTLIKRGFTNQAMMYFEMAYQGDKSDIIVIGNIAEAAMLMADFQKAQTFLLKKVSFFPEQAAIYFDLAINSMHAEPKVSLPFWKSYSDAHAKHPDDEQWAKTARSIQDAVMNSPSDVDLWHDLATQMIQSGVIKYAIPLLYYVGQQRPHDVTISYAMAHAYDVGKNYDLQEKSLLVTLRRLGKLKNETQINKDEIYYNLSRSSYMLDRLDDSLGYLSNISDKMKKTANIDYMYGLVYRDRGDKQKAQGYFRSCIMNANGSSIEQYCHNQL